MLISILAIMLLFYYVAGFGIGLSSIYCILITLWSMEGK